jgi:lipopolysaccharide biosynthesis glycosyltransferase
MTLGYLYVANKQKFVNEAMVSAQSLKQFSSLPIALVCTQQLATEAVNAFFDYVITEEELHMHLYLAKIIGMQRSPFDNTIFLDSDTFVCADISPIFELLQIADIATTQERSYHTTENIENIRFKNIIPEFNSGVILYKKNNVTTKLLSDWLQICIDNNIKNDMPGLRESILRNFDVVKYLILPEEYNSHGYKTMLMLYGEVKVIHERLGTSLKTITPHFLSFEEGRRFGQKINKKQCKRFYLPYIGIVPYNWSLYNIFFKIKKLIGVKRISKNK